MCKSKEFYKRFFRTLFSNPNLRSYKRIFVGILIGIILSWIFAIPFVFLFNPKYYKEGIFSVGSFIGYTFISFLIGIAVTLSLIIIGSFIVYTFISFLIVLKETGD
jgi:hypothetical protein